ncbi:copper amine oxidase N-terminal domain-containing protein [Alkaliphilus transvaalensis]|uniref:copper amine oxidase N-terminal domain-containing protein n=1 Tax=Alkaliphilus transvaalensis TaxID=114628 RepID=UPI00047DBF62|nr:copper amine oxidase N-terminal domain-containing protein [Alkaliphilus transvaalensis]
MLKKLTVSILTFILLAYSSLSWGATLFEEITVYYNNIQVRFQDESLTLDEEPFMYNERIYLPIRAISEGLGYQIDYDEHTHTVTISDKTALEKLPAANPLEGEAFVYGEIRKIDFEKKLIEIEQHIENNSREVFEGLSPIDDAVFLLKRNAHHFNISFEDLKVGDVVGIILTKENEIRGMIVD